MDGLFRDSCGGFCSSGPDARCARDRLTVGLIAVFVVETLAFSSCPTSRSDCINAWGIFFPEDWFPYVGDLCLVYLSLLLVLFFSPPDWKLKPAQPAHPLIYYLPLGFLLVRTCRTVERFRAGLKVMLSFFRFFFLLLASAVIRMKIRYILLVYDS